ncbi:hypothetical protein GGS23DRAFT_591825 [Durotheca rogersii]|uniref:uncharacterized protein n=1 Tax=Durotheca rogersii TaxID=419775 RepID=UPI00221EA2F8|nr:uncharacterized protein GGS23DRAFT_591825 [Durotheca rogersii]KAI5868023.1 hypothetical protein GGS23DRAFT_591825 [Durotheca rogersii]
MTISKPKALPSLQSCCTCATLLCEVPRHGPSEKPLPLDRHLDCCQRVICGNCRNNNPRFSSYCPYCQISQTGTVLPPDLDDPPSYSSSVANHPSRDDVATAPPPYTPCAAQRPEQPGEESGSASSEKKPAEDTLHFLNHAHDSIQSLSLRYGVPAMALKRANNITSDHLLLGRRAVVIPGEYYKGGVSLSPRPVEGEEEEARKTKIRRWMVACKVHEYDVAVLYLEQASYDLTTAMEAFFADEEWERTHPIEVAGRGKGVAKGASSGHLLWRGRR